MAYPGVGFLVSMGKYFPISTWQALQPESGKQASSEYYQVYFMVGASYF